MADQMATDDSIWKPVSSKQAGIVGFLEVFPTASGITVSVPGTSRWIDGPVLDLLVARAIPD